MEISIGIDNGAEDARSSSATMATTSGQAPKMMSSRLMTMKFMQRAVASAPSSTQSTPHGQSNKRQKTKSSPTPGARRTEYERLQDALAEEEAIRQKALEKQGADLGETKWVLSFQAEPRDSDGGGGTQYGEGSEDETWRSSWNGRQLFGNFKRATVDSGEFEESSASGDSYEDDDDDNDDDVDVDDDDDDPSGAGALIREVASKRSARSRADPQPPPSSNAKKMKARERTEQEGPSNVRPNKITSISNAGSQSADKQQRRRN